MRAVGVVYLLLPQIQMLFMGEEWGATQPFPLFCNFGPDLAQAVREGRREEFARLPEFQDPATRERIPDPTVEETFTSAQLDWGAIAREPHRAQLEWHRRILDMRHKEIVPCLPTIRAGGTYRILGDGGVLAAWRKRRVVARSEPVREKARRNPDALRARDLPRGRGRR